jgi:hypothetical protein
MSLLTILLIVLGVAIVALGSRVLVPICRRRRTPPELRGEWWPRFESELRAYAERSRAAGDEAGHRVRDGKHAR